ncbi:hypothetical protein FIBSPDRAFT_888952 [Athelia psychrophila]|uniref:Uncharacterized protein n=1 Tax=Athelia psychrophila TaxID=1759441 RepID=A0A166MR10_9AGAM|nr:hypothetical protein FIBSPDRAFT_888952 [Fibularhizoctonia sp. CBS 109695]
MTHSRLPSMRAQSSFQHRYCRDPDAATPTAPATEVDATSHVPAEVAPREYLSVAEFLDQHKATQWRKAQNGMWSIESGANMKELKRLAGLERSFLLHLDGIATCRRASVLPDGLLHAVSKSGNAYQTTGPRDGCAIFPKPPNANPLVNDIDIEDSEEPSRRISGPPNQHHFALACAFANSLDTLANVVYSLSSDEQQYDNIGPNVF